VTAFLEQVSGRAGGSKRQRLLDLIADAADHGNRSPRVDEMAEQLGVPDRDAVDALLRRLAYDGLPWFHYGIQSRHIPNRYVLLARAVL
jgi:SOS-response transcriptional repressor LexA